MPPASSSLSTPVLHDFGRVGFGTTRTLTITLRNEGSADVELLAFEQEEPNPDFAVTSFTPGVVPPSGTASVEVAWTPRDEGSPRTTFIARYTGGTVTTVVAGTPVIYDCALPTALTFGSVLIGSDQTLSLSINNTSDHDSVFTVGPIVGDAAFVASTSGEVHLLPRESTVVRFTFRPTEVRDYSASVKLRVTDLCPEADVRLSGSGVEQVISCEGLDFGYLPPGRSVTRSVRLSNAGLGPVRFAASTRVGTGPTTEFTVGSGIQVLPSTGELLVPVTFSPAVLGLRNARLVLETDLASSPVVSCPLRGVGGGPDIEVTPAVVDFGEVPHFAGQPYSVTRTATVSNLGTHQTDVKGNLHLLRWFVTPKNADSPAGAICVGARDAAGACLNRLPSSYDPVVGIVALPSGALALPIHVSPVAAGKDLAWDVTLVSDDLDEPEVVFTVKARSVAATPCAYTVTPPVLDFGLMPEWPRERAVTIHNDGTNANEICFIDHVSLTPGTASIYALPGGVLEPQRLLPGQSIEVRVRATPSGTVAAAVGAIEIAISSLAAPVTRVMIAGAVVQSCLAFFPHQVSFGAVKQGCAGATRSVSIHDGCGGLLVDAWAVRSAEFTTTGTAAAGSAPTSVDVHYAPWNAGPDLGAVELTVKQGGQLVTYAVPLDGSGNATGDNVETFVEPATPKRDVLLVIDDSQTDPQTFFAMNAPQFLAAAAPGTDYQVGVIATELGWPTLGQLLGSPRILTPSTPNVAAQLAARVQLGNNGFMESVAWPALKALTPPLSTGHNAGFLRPDARLSIIGLTTAGETSPLGAGYLHAALAALKPRGHLTYSVMGPFSPFSPSGCAYDGFSDPAKHRFLVSRLDGVQEEVCSSNWPAAVSNLGQSAFHGGSNLLYLRGDPDPSTLSVEADGSPVAASLWTWDAERNAVSFNPVSAPAPGQTFTVRHTALCH